MQLFDHSLFSKQRLHRISANNVTMLGTEKIAALHNQQLHDCKIYIKMFLSMSK